MNIITTWHGDQFNVELAASEGADAFLSIKGCRIASGSKGPFVSWPATKNASSGKWWNHVWANDKFSDAVLAKAQASQPQQQPMGRQQRGQDDMPESIPF